MAKRSLLYTADGCLTIQRELNHSP